MSREDKQQFTSGVSVTKPGMLWKHYSKVSFEKEFEGKYDSW